MNHLEDYQIDKALNVPTGTLGIPEQGDNSTFTPVEKRHRDKRDACRLPAAGNMEFLHDLVPVGPAALFLVNWGTGPYNRRV